MEKVEHSPKAMSAIYSNAAKAAEKQMRFEEATLFSDLSAHFDGKSEKKSATSIDEVKPFITEDLTSLYKEAEALALKEPRSCTCSMAPSCQIRKVTSEPGAPSASP